MSFMYIQWSLIDLQQKKKEKGVSHGRRPLKSLTRDNTGFYVYFSFKCYYRLINYAKRNAKYRNKIYHE